MSSSQDLKVAQEDDAESKGKGQCDCGSDENTTEASASERQQTSEAIDQILKICLQFIPSESESCVADAIVEDSSCVMPTSAPDDPHEFVNNDTVVPDSPNLLEPLDLRVQTNKSPKNAAKQSYSGNNSTSSSLESAQTACPKGNLLQPTHKIKEADEELCSCQTSDSGPREFDTDSNDQESFRGNLQGLQLTRDKDQQTTGSEDVISGSGATQLRETRWKDSSRPEMVNYAKNRTSTPNGEERRENKAKVKCPVDANVQPINNLNESKARCNCPTSQNSITQTNNSRNFQTDTKAKNAKNEKISSMKIPKNPCPIANHLQPLNLTGTSPKKGSKRGKTRKYYWLKHQDTKGTKHPIFLFDDEGMLTTVDVRRSNDSGGTEVTTESASAHSFQPHSYSHASAEKAGAQAVVGCVFGCVGGFMDAIYTEPFGVIIGISLIALQALDRQNCPALPWNTRTKSRSSSKSKNRHNTNCSVEKMVNEMTNFSIDNAYVFTGFAGGYLVGNVLADAYNNTTCE